MDGKIEHVVVLMLENRSFDHMLGFLDHPSTSFPRITDDVTNPDIAGNQYPASAGATVTIRVSPGHHHHQVMYQLAPDGDLVNNQGFVTGFERLAAAKGHPDLGPEIMKCQHPDNIPVLATLAKQFAVCVRWHCSVPGMTWPNRNFAHAGTSDGEVDIDKRFYNNITIFEELSIGKKDWRIYSDNNALTQAYAFQNLWGYGNQNRFQNLNKFIRRAREGRLPHYSFIEPDHFIGYSSSQHPMNNKNSSDDFYAGEALIEKVYNALRSNSKTWEHSLLIITYDEHGGFFDREPPSRDSKFKVNEKHSDFEFDLLGPRVPAVVVSPYIEAGTIVNELFEHTSIMKTVRDVHLPGTQYRNREQHVGTALSVLNRDTPRESTDLPDLLEVELARAPFGTDSLNEYVGPKIDFEVDDFQESLLWLHETIQLEKDLADDLKHVDLLSAKRRSPQLLQERIAAEAKTREVRNKWGERLAILRKPDGNIIERPTDVDINEVVVDKGEDTTWIEDLPDILLEWNPEGTLSLSDNSGDRIITANVEQARVAFKALSRGDLITATVLFEE